MPQAVAWAAYSFVQAAGTLGISQATAVAVLDAAIKTALLAGINAAVQQNNEPEVQGGMVNLTINATEPRRLQIGQRINGGILVDWYVRGSKNQNLYLVIYLGEGPQGRLTKITAGGRDVYNTPINHGVRTTIPDFRSGGDRLWVTYYDGRPGQTADTTLVGKGLGWTSNCIGEGCAYVIVECQWDEDNLTSPPSLGFETEGAKLYDRRLDTTAGGSGDHRLDDPDTWELSKNPAVALDHYLLGRFTSNGTKAFGIGIDPDDLPYDRFEALANLCDESVTLSGGGSQARYEANGFLFADRTNEDTIKDLCRAMNARPADFGGRVGILDGQSRSAVLTLYDEDVIDTSAEQYRPKRAWAELVNEVRGTYISPTQNYQAVDFPRVTDATWLSDDNDEPRETTLNLEMEVNAERAQRLAWLHAMRERRQAQLSGIYHLKAIELEQGDWFVRAGGIFGAGKTFEVIDRSLDPETFTVTITAFEVDAADTAWSTDIPSDPPPDGTPDDSSLAAMEVPAITVTGLTLSGTDAEVPAIKVEWDAPDDPAVRQILIEYAPTGGDVASTLIDVSAGAAVFTNGITDDTDYLVHARFVGAGIPSDWTSDYAVTTSGTFSVGVAQAIVGQQWGATATESEASNARHYLSNHHVEFGSGVNWSAAGYAGAGSPDAVASDGTLSSAFYFTSAGTYGPAIRMQDLGVGRRDLKHAGGIRLVPGGKTWVRATYDVRFASNESHIGRATLGASWFDKDWNYLGWTVLDDDNPIPSYTLNRLEGEFLHDTVFGINSAAVYARPFLFYNWNVDSDARFDTYELDWKTSQFGADITEDNTADSIVDQGNLATGNMYYQASAPASPANGDFWGKPNDALYYRSSGAWQKVASLGGGFKAVAASDNVESDGNIDYHNFAIPSVTASGAVGSVSTARSILIGTSSKWSISGSTLILNNADTGENSAVVRVTLTDAGTGEKASVDIGFSYYYY